MIHPTVKKYLGKAPKGTPPENSTSQQSSASLQMTSQSAKVRVTTEQGTEKIGSMSLDALPGMVGYCSFALIFCMSLVLKIPACHTQMIGKLQFMY